MTRSDDHDLMLTPEEVALALKISVRTLADWRQRKMGPIYTRVGSQIRYPVADVRDYLEERRSNREPGDE